MVVICTAYFEFRVEIFVAMYRRTFVKGVFRNWKIVVDEPLQHSFAGRCEIQQFRFSLYLRFARGYLNNHTLSLSDSLLR